MYRYVYSSSYFICVFSSELMRLNIRNEFDTKQFKQRS